MYRTRTVEQETLKARKLFIVDETWILTQDYTEDTELVLPVPLLPHPLYVNYYGLINYSVILLYETVRRGN